MSIALYDRTRNGNPINPALALRRHWTYILKHSPTARIEADGEFRAHVRYEAGILSAYSGWVDYCGLRINAKGHFTLSAHLHGSHQRDKVSEQSFLRWHYFRGYSWWVDTETLPTPTSGYYSSPRDGGYDCGSRGILGQPAHRIPYVAESTGIFARGTPLRLEHVAGQWHIRATESETQHLLDAWQVKRERRYDRIERERMIRQGVIQPRVRKPVDEAAREQREEDALQAIIARMNVNAPIKRSARTTEEVV